MSTDAKRDAAPDWSPSAMASLREFANTAIANSDGREGTDETLPLGCSLLAALDAIERLQSERAEMVGAMPKCPCGDPATRAHDGDLTTVRCSDPECDPGYADEFGYTLAAEDFEELPWARFVGELKP